MPYNPGKTPFIVVPGMGDGLGGVSRPFQRLNTKKSSATIARSTGESSAPSASDECDKHGNPRFRGAYHAKCPKK